VGEFFLEFLGKYKKLLESSQKLFRFAIDKGGILICDQQRCRSFGKMRVPLPNGNNKKMHTTVYQTFRGVDFSTDPALVDSRRSPAAVNLVSDAGGYPEKRLGWRTVIRAESAERVNGLHRAVFTDGEVRLAHIGTTIYRWERDTLSVLRENVADMRST
jgi:hypothetical protein